MKKFIILFMLLVLSFSVSALITDTSIAYYSFDNNCTADDWINDRNANTTTGTWTASGNVSGACDYESSGGYQFTGIADSPLWDGDKTVTFLAKIEDIDTAGGGQASFYFKNFDISLIHTWLNNANPTLCIQRAGSKQGGTAQQIDYVMTKDTDWHFYVIQCNNGIYPRFWIDGINVLNGSTSTGVCGNPDQTPALMIGGADDTQDWDGLIDEFGVYTDLTNEQILAIWNDGDICNPLTSGDDCGLAILGISNLTLSTTLKNGKYTTIDNSTAFNETHLLFNVTGVVNNTLDSNFYCSMKLNTTEIFNVSVVNISLANTYGIPSENISESYLVNVTCGNNNATDSFLRTVYINTTIQSSNVIITLITPDDNNITIDRTPEFIFNASQNLTGTLGCDLLVNDTIVANNATALDGGITTLIPGGNLEIGVHQWYINCTDGTSTGQSTTRNIEIIATNLTITLIVPDDNNITIDRTPEFIFNASVDLIGTLGCDLLVNDTIVANNATALDGGITTLIPSGNLGIGWQEWYINCTDGTSTGQSTTRNIEIAPVVEISSVYITPDPLTKNDTATCNVVQNYADTLAYAWYNNSVLIGGETTSTLGSEFFSLGIIVNCTVTGTNTTTSSVAINSAITTVQSIPPIINSIYATPQYANSDDAIHCNFNVTDIDLSETLIVNVTWFRANDDGLFVNVPTYNYGYSGVTRNTLVTTTVGTGSVATPITNYTNWKCSIVVSDNSSSINYIDISEGLVIVPTVTNPEYAYDNDTSTYAVFNAGDWMYYNLSYQDNYLDPSKVEVTVDMHTIDSGFITTAYCIDGPDPVTDYYSLGTLDGNLGRVNVTFNITEASGCLDIYDGFVPISFYTASAGGARIYEIFEVEQTPIYVRDNSTNVVSIYPLENLTVYEPENNTISNEQLIADFSVIDKDEGIQCRFSVKENYITNAIDWYPVNATSYSPVSFDEFIDLSNAYDGNLATYASSDGEVTADGVFNFIKSVPSTNLTSTIISMSVLIEDNGVGSDGQLTFSCYDGSGFTVVGVTPTDFSFDDTKNISINITNNGCLNYNKTTINIYFFVINAPGGQYERIYEVLNISMYYQSDSIFYSVVSGTNTSIQYNFTDDGTYDWNVSCTANGEPDSLYSSNYIYRYDTTAPVASNFGDDSTPAFPEIGDTIQLTATITDLFTIDSCKLWINDTTIYEVKQTIEINTPTTSNLSMNYTIQPISQANNSNTGWFVECNDSVGNIANSSIQSFEVVDTTNPIIVFLPGNFFSEDNRSVISNHRRNGTINLQFWDYNLFQILVNITCEFNGSIYSFEELNLNATNFTLSDTVDMTGLPLQKCEVFISVSDDHTDEEIGNYIETTILDGIEFDTDRNINIKIKSKDGNVKEVKTTKEEDRVRIDFEFTDLTLTRAFEVQTDKELYMVNDDRYPGHAVIWDNEAKTGQWIDFAVSGGISYNYIVEKQNKNKYEVIIEADIPESQIILTEKGQELLDKNNGTFLLYEYDDKYIENYNELLAEYGISLLQFESIGGTNVVNSTYVFYIGSAITVSSFNVYNSSTFINFTINITTVNSFPGFNGTIQVGAVDSYWVENLSNGTYTFILNHPHYYSFLYNVTVENNSQSINYTTYQSILNFRAINFRSSEILDNFNVTIVNAITNQTDTLASGNETVVTFYVDSTNYTYLYEKIAYIDLSGNVDVTYKENKTVTVAMYFVATFILTDERTLDAFNISKTDEIKFKLFCPNETIQYIINETITEIPFTCDYLYARFILYYTLVDGPFNYYRTLLIEPVAGLNYSVYLIDMTDTSYVFNTFTIDDLLGEYINVSIWVKKRIPGETAEITADFVDINNKIGAYLIENDEYIIEVHSANQPIRVMGAYIASQNGDKSLRLYDINIDATSDSFSNDVSFGLTKQNQSGTQTFVGYYKDTADLTNSVTFYLWKDSYNGTLIASDTITTDLSLGVIYELNITAYENDTLYGGITIDHTLGQAISSKLINEVTRILPDAFAHISAGFLSWFFLILLGGLAIFGSIRTGNMLSMVLVGLASLFVIFDWFTISSSILALSALVSLVSILKEGSK